MDPTAPSSSAPPDRTGCFPAEPPPATQAGVHNTALLLTQERCYVKLAPLYVRINPSFRASGSVPGFSMTRLLGRNFILVRRQGR